MGNNMKLSLKDFNLCFNVESNIVYVELIDNNLSRIALRFDTIEEAFIFMKKTINKCSTINEVIEVYDMINSEDVNKNKIMLAKDEVANALIEYYGGNKDNKISVDEDNNRLYLHEYYMLNGIIKELRTLLSKNDIRMALDNYINDYYYETLDFKFINDNDNKYNGLELKVKEKGHSLTKKKSDN